MRFLARLTRTFTKSEQYRPRIIADTVSVSGFSYTRGTDEATVSLEAEDGQRYQLTLTSKALDTLQRLRED